MSGLGGEPKSAARCDRMEGGVLKTDVGQSELVWQLWVFISTMCMVVKGKRRKEMHVHRFFK